MVSQIARSHDLFGRRTVACTADAPRSIQFGHGKSEFSIQPFHARGGLIDQHDGAAVLREPRGRPLLIIPGEPALRVVRELDIVGRIGIDEVVTLERNRLDVADGEGPIVKRRLIAGKIVDVPDAGVASERLLNRQRPL